MKKLLSRGKKNEVQPEDIMTDQAEIGMETEIGIETWIETETKIKTKTKIGKRHRQRERQIQRQREKKRSEVQTNTLQITCKQTAIRVQKICSI